MKENMKFLHSISVSLNLLCVYIIGEIRLEASGNSSHEWFMLAIMFMNLTSAVYNAHLLFKGE